MVDSEAQERTAFVSRLPKAGWCLGTRLQATIIDERMITLYLFTGAETISLQQASKGKWSSM